MPRSALVTFLIATGIFLTGFCLGLSMSGNAPNRIAGGNADAAPSRSTSNGLDGAQVDSLLPARARQLQYDLDQEKQKESELLLKDHLELFKKYGLSPSAWGEDMKVTDEMADFLRLTSDERKAVNALLAETFARNRALELQHLKLVSQKDNTVTYEVSPYPEGTPLRDEFKRAMETALGAARAAVLVQNRSWEMSQSFSDFGVNPTLISLTRTDENGPPSYTLMETHANGSMTSPIGNRLPPHLAGLLQFDTKP